MSIEKKRILVFIDWYLPGFRGGGPISSIANLVEALADRYHFSIVTSDRDYGQKLPYEGIVQDQWMERSPNCRVWYCSQEGDGYRHIRKIIADTPYDLLYLNSMFSLRFTIYPLWSSRATKPHIPVLLAPRGMLHVGALSLKPLKKRLFLKLIRWIGIHKQVHFHATYDVEVEDLERIFGTETTVVSSPNLPRVHLPSFLAIPKESGELKVIFLSRLTQHKGLHLILEWLKDQDGQIKLDIVGPDEEPGYWDLCKKLVADLPDNVTVRKHDAVPPGEATALLQRAHCLMMPTRGENFGHAIFEAFCAGRPVLISDQTPWRGLEASKLGFDIALDDVEGHKRALVSLVEMNQEEWNAWARASWGFAADHLAKSSAVETYYQMFDSLIAKPSEA
jgi:glycosyltransferase involved in cell wall biosynthesis